MNFKEILQKNTKNNWFQIANYILFLAVGVFLLYLAFSNQDIDQLMHALNSANYYYLVPLFIVTVINHLARAARWQLMIKSAGYFPKYTHVLTTMLFGYFVNYGIPRIGELVRCWGLQKRDKTPMTFLFGTVMLERLIDLLLLLVLVAVVFVFQYHDISYFFNNQIFAPLLGWLQSKILSNKKLIILICALVLMVIYWAVNKGKKAATATNINKLETMIDEVWIGLNTMAKIKNHWLFAAYTLIIWIGYFFTTYFWILAFEETQNFTLMSSLTVMVVGTLGRSLPIQGGGMGSYHFFVAKILLVFGVSETIGNAFAIVNHGSQAVFQIVVGILSGLYVFYSKKE